MGSDGMSPRRAATRDRLCDAAMGVIAEKGVLGASIEEICDAAGFTRGAFYSNFAGRDELCAAIMERQASVALALLGDTVAHVRSSPDESLDELIERAVKMFLSAQPGDRPSILVTQELQLYAAREPAFAPVYTEQQRRGMTALSELVARALTAHGYAWTIDPVDAVGVLYAVHNHGELSTILGSGSFAGERRIRLLTQVVRSLIRPI